MIPAALAGDVSISWKFMDFLESVPNANILN